MRCWRRGVSARIQVAAFAVILSASALADLGTTVARAAGPQQTAEQTASDGANGDAFGVSSAISASGNTAVVGAFLHASGKGAVYVFTGWPFWRQTFELTASDGASHDNFGNSVAISPDGDTIVVGAPGHSSGKGAVYVFARRGLGWIQAAELTAGDAASGDNFGTSVAISAYRDTIVVGAPSRATYEGAAYVFTRSWFGWHWSGWHQEAELTASDGASQDDFGFSVAISWDGDTVAVGAFHAPSTPGKAYVFSTRPSGWHQEAELTPSDSANGNEFGFSVALSRTGHVLVVGAIGHATATGSAYIFTRWPSWHQTAELTASDGAHADKLGYSAAISADGRAVLLGAIGHLSSTGAAYVFTRSGASWSQADELTASDGVTFDFFGLSVGFSGPSGTAVIGAVGNGTPGKAYIFTGLP
jgi:hypothetical protein